MDQPTFSSAREPASPAEAHHQIHNDGHKRTRGHMSRSSSIDSTSSLLVASSKVLASVAGETIDENNSTDRKETGSGSESAVETNGTTTPLSTSTSTSTISAIPVVLNKNKNKNKKPTVFSAQNYLRYQGDKFIHRFDANCYIALTRKMDVHDVAAGRGELVDVLDNIVQPSLVIGVFCFHTSFIHNDEHTRFISICAFHANPQSFFFCSLRLLIIGVESDGLFTISEQYELAEHLHNSEMVVVQSPDGHDGFLLEFEQINNAILSFMSKHQHIRDILSKEGIQSAAEVGAVVKESLFGESEIVNW